MHFLVFLYDAFARFFGRGRRLELKADNILSKQVIIMGKLEDLATSFSTSLAAIGAAFGEISTEMATLHTELTAAVAAGQAPSADTLATLETLSTKAADLASQATALAAANAPAPAPTPAAPAV